MSITLRIFARPVTNPSAMSSVSNSFSLSPALIVSISEPFLNDSCYGVLTLGIPYLGFSMVLLLLRLLLLVTRF
jgi:hypothetical protein